MFKLAVCSKRSLASAIDSALIVLVAARVDKLRISDDIFEPVYVSVPAILARPPTSATDGRNVNPKRRTAGSLLILAASTRELRPLVLTAASNPVRAVETLPFVLDARAAAVAARVAVFDVDVALRTDVVLVDRTPVRDDSVRDVLSDLAAVGITRDGVTDAVSAANAVGVKQANAKKHVRNFFILGIIISQVPAT